jgi:hypothetical protein
MGHGNNLVLQFGIISDLFVCDDQSLSPFSMEESWSSVDPKGSKFAKWFHFEGMKQTPIVLIFYFLTTSVCCVMCVFMVSVDVVFYHQLRPSSTIIL